MPGSLSLTAGTPAYFFGVGWVSLLLDESVLFSYELNAEFYQDRLGPAQEGKQNDGVANACMSNKTKQNRESTIMDGSAPPGTTPIGRATATWKALTAISTTDRSQLAVDHAAAWGQLWYERNVTPFWRRVTKARG